jgi:hypothetical protein
MRDELSTRANCSFDVIWTVLEDILAAGPRLARVSQRSVRISGAKKEFRRMAVTSRKWLIENASPAINVRPANQWGATLGLSLSGLAHYSQNCDLRRSSGTTEPHLQPTTCRRHTSFASGSSTSQTRLRPGPASSRSPCRGGAAASCFLPADRFIPIAFLCRRHGRRSRRQGGLCAAATRPDPFSAQPPTHLPQTR